MGGLVCMVHRQAVLEFQSIPTTPPDLAKFDAQIRAVYNVESIASSLVNDAPTQVQAVCTALAKSSFDDEDRRLLYSVLEALYTPYS